MRFLVRGGGGGGEGGKGMYKFSSQIFFWRSEFSRFGRGGGRGGLSFLSRSEF